MIEVNGKRLLACLVAALIVAAGCGGAGSATVSPTTAVAPSPTAGAAGSASPSGELPKPELTKLQIGLNGTEVTQIAPKIADLMGYWKANGIEAEITVFEGDGKVMQALQAGQLDIGLAAGVAMVNTLLTDAPVTALGTSGVLLNDALIGGPKLKTADDLRGKCVGISSFGGTSHGSALLSLKALGLTPQDVVLTVIGGQSARIAALKGGSCAAAPVDALVAQKDLTPLGFNMLVNLRDAKLQWARTAFGARADWIKQNPNTALVAMATILQAQNLYWTQPDLAAQKLADISQLDPDTAKSVVADFQTIGDRTLMWDDSAFENGKEVLASVNPDVAKVDVSQAFDRSILQKLVDLGYYQKLDIPLK